MGGGPRVCVSCLGDGSSWLCGILLFFSEEMGRKMGVSVELGNMVVGLLGDERICAGSQIPGMAMTVLL